MPVTLPEAIMKLLRLFACAAPVVLAACAASPAAQQQRAARVAVYRAAAGAPVHSFTYIHSLYSWEPIDERTLVVYTRPKQAWLLTVGPCPDLPYTVSIGLTEHVGQVSSGLDSVWTDRRQFPCRIQEIRPVDMDKVHAARAERRKIEAMPRDGDAPTPDS
jgi:hypothetical protein